MTARPDLTEDAMLDAVLGRASGVPPLPLERIEVGALAAFDATVAPPARPAWAGWVAAAAAAAIAVGLATPLLLDRQGPLPVHAMPSEAATADAADLDPADAFAAALEGQTVSTAAETSDADAILDEVLGSL